MFKFGQVLMIIGLLFKVGAVPFHFWTPDAYTGAAVAVTGYMGAVVKVAGFAALGSIWLNLVMALNGTPANGPFDLGAGVLIGSTVTAHDSAQSLTAYSLVFLVLALISIVLGNFSALRQTSARRLIAYSSISHAGYMLLAFALPGYGAHFALNSLWYYVIAYAVATAGALAALAALSGRDDTQDSLSGLAGQGRAQPFYGLVLTIFLVSIAGIPLTIGFLGKFMIFQDLVTKGDVRIAVFAMLMAVVGAGYYFKLIVCLWASPTKEPAKAGSPVLAYAVLSLAALASVGLIAWPNILTPPTAVAKPVALEAVPQPAAEPIPAPAVVPR